MRRFYERYRTQVALAPRAAVRSLMADGTPEKGREGFVPLRIACARVYHAVTGNAPQGSAHWDPLLDTAAISLCTVARIHATDPLTNLLFPVSSDELLRGRFENGAGRFVLDGEVRYAGLYVPAADVEDAIRLLARS